MIETATEYNARKAKEKEGVVVDATVVDSGKKEELQAILDEAGIEYSKQLGVKKLQALVDGLQEEGE